MYDERTYMSCCQCAVVFRRDDAVRHPDLYGGFCSEVCALRCFRQNNPPQDAVWQLQAGDNYADGQQVLQFDDLNPWITPGWQHE